MKKLKSLSIFFPAYNDARSIGSLVSQAYKTGLQVAKSLEVIVINDASQDNTQQVLKDLKIKHPHLKIVRHEKNRGYGGTLRSGFETAQKEWVFYTDGDGQYDPKELKKLVQKLNGTVTVVNGYKLQRKDPWIRIFLGKMYNAILQKIYKLPVRDIDCDFRLIKRSLLRNVSLASRTGTVCLELVVKLQQAGAKFAEVGVHHYPRRHGVSQFFRLSSILNTAYENLHFLQTAIKPKPKGRSK